MSIWETNGGLYLGVGTGGTETPRSGNPKYDQRNIIPYVDDRHAFLVGPNGSGKTRRLFLHNVACLTEWSYICVDPKGVLATMARNGVVKNMVVIDPFGVLPGTSAWLNPVASLDPNSDEFEDDAMLMAEALIRPGEKEPHWGESAQEIVAGLIMYSRFSKGRHGSLPDVRRLLSLPPTEMRKEAKLMGEIAEKYDCDAITHKTAKLLEWTPENKELNSIISTALTQTRWLDSKPIIRNLEEPEPDKSGAIQPPVDFSQLKDVATKIFLILPPKRLRTHATWLKLVITSILQPLMMRTKVAKVPVLFMLDEYYAIAKGGFPVIEDNMAMLREYGIKLWIALQDLSQAHMLWGRDGFQSYVANAGIFQAFGVHDVLTAKFVSDLSGEEFIPLTNTSKGTSLSPSGSPTINRGDSVNHIKVPIIWPEQVRNMDDGYSIIYSHKLKGPLFSYLPYPTLISHLAPFVAGDPSV